MQPRPGDVPDRNGMPGFGFGTFENEDPDTCAESVRTALELGYRHIDTAQLYDNEAAVGRGIAESSVDREDVFLATKLWFDDLAREDVLEAAQESLDRLGTDYVDVLYVHWPAGAYDPEETLPAFQKLREEGAIEHIGVSNFEPHQIETARSVLDAPIFANQVEIHPLFQQETLREFCSEAGIELVAYAPIARTEVFDVDVISEIAAAHDVSEAQVSLAWLRQRGLTPIPKATGRDHIEDNWRSLTLELDDDELARIDALDRNRRLVNPDFMEGW
jgi:diketogulonate reductase-like aldo/keto reductase